MPQISPLSWIFLFISFNLILMVFANMMHPLQKTQNYLPKTKKSHKTPKW